MTQHFPPAGGLKCQGGFVSKAGPCFTPNEIFPIFISLGNTTILFVHMVDGIQFSEDKKNNSLNSH